MGHTPLTTVLGTKNLDMLRRLEVKDKNSTPIAKGLCSIWSCKPKKEPRSDHMTRIAGNSKRIKALLNKPGLSEGYKLTLQQTLNNLKEDKKRELSRLEAEAEREARCAKND